MKLRIIATFVVAVTLMLSGVAIASQAGGAAPPQPHQQHRSLPASCTFQTFRPWAKEVWNDKHWKRHHLSPAATDALHKRLGCAPAPHRKAMKDLWRKQKKAFHRYQKAERWYFKYRHYEYPDGSHWAVPYPIAWCESGGDYHISSAGAYGEVPPLPQNQPPKVQDEIAYGLFQEQGEGPWKPYEKECPYR